MNKEQREEILDILKDVEFELEDTLERQIDLKSREYRLRNTIKKINKILKT